MARRKKKFKIKRILFLIIIIIGIVFGIKYGLSYLSNKKLLTKYYIASSDNNVEVFDELKKESIKLIRGSEIEVYDKVKLDDGRVTIKYNSEKEYFVEPEVLVKELKDTLLMKNIYVRTSVNLRKDLDSISLGTLASKGDNLEITGFDKYDEDGNVINYKVKVKDEEGYINHKYLSLNQEEANSNYNENGIYDIHKKLKDNLGGGNGADLDYFPVVKGNFSNNKMPDNVYALYLNGGKNVIGDVDSYIAYAKTTKINAFVVDIKDSGAISYPAKTMEELSPTSYKNAMNSYESFKAAIQKIKDNGFYAIGRITTFKDTYFVKDHPEYAISNSSGKSLYHQSSYWPSAYFREVWEYNVKLAMESVKEMGFNEIQFDYVRFPDGLRTMEKNKTVNYHNSYNETKAQAIQRFLMYATDELHKLDVYVSCDVFGESSAGYITSYGQYWPAISNVVDVISAMPYTDHFDQNNSRYWVYPGQTMTTWGKTAVARQKETPTPAIARTWITAYNTPYWNPTVNYDGSKITEQVEALYKLGLNGGYMTWNSASSLSKYKNQKSGYSKEYK